ncbi:hypothetical protein NL676_016212 [Syzygium grande]|nr:hypothetical protein NL676_016212 [Syzygium grande]
MLSSPARQGPSLFPLQCRPSTPRLLATHAVEHRLSPANPPTLNSIVIPGGSPSNFNLDDCPFLEADLFSSNALAMHSIALDPRFLSLGLWKLLAGVHFFY